MDSEWELYPLGGETGQAYRGEKASEYIFFKRNTTPFLAAVSATGLAPKLLWTRRTIHGEEIAAQEWIDARVLESEEMVEMDILEVIRYVHQSKILKQVLQKVDGYIWQPIDFLKEYQKDLHTDLRTHHFLNDVYYYLERTAGAILDTEKVVCHGDVTRRNFLLEEESRLYLVDWENVCLADPFLDIAMLLCQYVERVDWLVWLDVYGMEISEQVLQRLEWYALYYCLTAVKKNHFQGHYHKMNRYILLIKDLLGRQRLI